MHKSSKIVFFGNERLSSGFSPVGAPTLQSLIDAGYKVVAVVAHHEHATSRKARPLEIAEVAVKNDIPLLLPSRLMDIKEQLANYGAEIGVLVAYGKIIPQEIIDIFPHGILNIHPSLLPRYRGSTPIEQAILDGANETGVSIMGLVKEMDAGPVYAQTTILLTGHESKLDLTQTLLTKGIELLHKSLPKVLADSARPMTQNESRATFTERIQKSDGKISATRTALQLERKIRAYAGWPKSSMTLFDHAVIITDVRVAKDPQDGALIIPCANNTYLEILKLIAPSGRTMSGADFLRGYKK